MLQKGHGNTGEVKSPLRVRNGVGRGRLPLKVLRKGQRGMERLGSRGRCSPFPAPHPGGPRPPSTSSPSVLFEVKPRAEAAQNPDSQKVRASLPFLPVPGGFLTCSPHLSSHSKVWPFIHKHQSVCCTELTLYSGPGGVCRGPAPVILTSYVTQG